MTDLTHLFKIGQKIKVTFDDFDCVKPQTHNGTITEVYKDHIIADVESVSARCWFESGFNLDMVQPIYDF